MIISRFPHGQPVTERAIPTPIFNTEPKIRNYFLRKWSHDSSITDFDIRNFIDWDYYIDRFSTTVRKIITIPAGIQNIDNPVERVKPPDWLNRLMQRNRSSVNQRKISGFFTVSKITPATTRVTQTIEPRKEEEPQESEITKPETPVEADRPRESVKRSSDFPIWLQQRKRQWSELWNSENRVDSMTPISHNSRGYYQILEVIHSAGNEDVLIWVLNPAGQLQRLRIQVNHVIYIHCATPLEDARLTAVQYTLPLEADRNGEYIYELQVSEKEMKRTLEEFQRLSLIYPILGIYNTQIPLDFWTLLQIGCVCRVALPTMTQTTGILKHAINLGRDPLDLTQFTSLTTDDAPYLT